MLAQTLPGATVMEKSKTVSDNTNNLQRAVVKVLPFKEVLDKTRTEIQRLYHNLQTTH